MKRLGGDALNLFGTHDKKAEDPAPAPTPAPEVTTPPPAQVSAVTSNDQANTVVASGTADPLASKKKKGASLSSTLGLNVG